MALSAARREDRRRRLVEAAQALIREGGDTGFSMTQLAARAGVSPATPYNLVGAKSELLRLIVRDEFESFAAKLVAVRHESPLMVLLDATALVVSHYEADRPFYRGLYRAAASVEATEVHVMMADEGRALWRGFVRDAVDSGELEAFVKVEPFTDVLLRNISATTQAWLADEWTAERFALEMAGAVRLVIASMAAPPIRDRLVREAVAAQTAITPSPAS